MDHLVRDSGTRARGLATGAMGWLELSRAPFLIVTYTHTHTGKRLYTPICIYTSYGVVPGLGLLELSRPPFRVASRRLCRFAAMILCCGFEVTLTSYSTPPG